jgi:hypothetical protein
VLRNWFPKPRWKTYAAQSGYVYQYVFEGLGADGTYIFRAVSGTAIELTLEVILDAKTLEPWVSQNRSLSEMECYGIAKMALLRALDEETTPGPARAPIRPTCCEVEAICRELDL